jgi:hypothetical protein
MDMRASGGKAGLLALLAALVLPASADVLEQVRVRVDVLEPVDVCRDFGHPDRHGALITRPLRGASLGAAAAWRCVAP